ncbi:MAG: hypothetical protein HQK52_22060 [Oligoflexia bacterium]|nr:hypothetical protein [Oligoflexia bacterium]
MIQQNSNRPYISLLFIIIIIIFNASNALALSDANSTKTKFTEKETRKFQPPPKCIPLKDEKDRPGVILHEYRDEFSNKFNFIELRVDRKHVSFVVNKANLNMIRLNPMLSKLKIPFVVVNNQAYKKIQSNVTKKKSFILPPMKAPKGGYHDGDDDAVDWSGASNFATRVINVGQRIRENTSETLDSIQGSNVAGKISGVAKTYRTAMEAEGFNDGVIHDSVQKVEDTFGTISRASDAFNLMDRHTGSGDGGNFIEDAKGISSSADLGSSALRGADKMFSDRGLSQEAGAPKEVLFNDAGDTSVTATQAPQDTSSQTQDSSLLEQNALKEPHFGDTGDAASSAASDVSTELKSQFERDQASSENCTESNQSADPYPSCNAGSELTSELSDILGHLDSNENPNSPNDSATGLANNAEDILSKLNLDNAQEASVRSNEIIEQFNELKSYAPSSDDISQKLDDMESKFDQAVEKNSMQNSPYSPDVSRFDDTISKTAKRIEQEQARPRYNHNPMTFFTSYY